MTDALKDAVKTSYGATARSAVDPEGAARIAAAFGYSAEDLAAIPDEANLGLSCGNPTAMASLRPGETVLDLGCGGGLDVFLAAKAVGPEGRAIGVDMTEDMLARARENAATGGYDNVEFHLAEIERMPLPDASVDCVISNCVLNLCPDKPAAFAEIFRVLKPGGRLAVSDIALKAPLPEDLKASLDAFVGCIAGAIPFAAYAEGLKGAGFDNIDIVDAGADLNAYGAIDGQAACCAPAVESCCAPAEAEPSPDVHAGLLATLRAHDVNAYAASVKVFALKA